jgi:hypothetical protein
MVLNCFVYATVQVARQMDPDRNHGLGVLLAGTLLAFTDAKSSITALITL